MGCHPTQQSHNWMVVVITTVLVMVAGSAVVVMGVLTGHGNSPRYDMTEDRRFGCQWSGGLDSRLTCNCQLDAETMVIEANGIPGFSEINRLSLANCHTVNFSRSALTTMTSLRHVTLTNISRLHFAPYSVQWEGNVLLHLQSDQQLQQHWLTNVPTLRVTIDRCHVDVISSNAFQGKLSEILIRDTVIDRIEPFGFSSVKYNDKFVMERCVVGEVSPHAFKKFETGRFVWENSAFGVVLPSRAVSELTIREELAVNNCTFAGIRSSSFIVTNPRRFEFVNSHVGTLEGGAFRVHTRGDVLFKNNQLEIVHEGAFREISVNLREVATSQNIRFINNSFGGDSFSSGILTTNSTSFKPPVFSQNHLLITCDCDTIDSLLPTNELLSEFTCLHNGEISLVCSEFKRSYCKVIPAGSTLYIVLGVSLIVLLLVVVGLVVFYKKFYRVKGSYGGGKQGEKQLGIIVPDGRTYRETELHVIVERTDLLTTDL